MPAIEHDLFIEWMKWLQANCPSHKFTYDGIVSMDDWLATPTKVLLVLKDYNDTRRADSHLPLDQFSLEDKDAIKANVPNLRYHFIFFPCKAGGFVSHSLSFLDDCKVSDFMQKHPSAPAYFCKNSPKKNKYANCLDKNQFT